MFSKAAVIVTFMIQRNCLAMQKNALATGLLRETTNRRGASTNRHSKNETDWGWYALNEVEVKNRGSFCIDGSTPGYFYAGGTEDDKWILSFEGGKMFCADENECVEMLSNKYASPDSMVYMTLFDSDAFSSFHKVQLHHCDGGMWMSDRSDAVVMKGHTMYFRGKRVLAHTLETLQAETPFGSAAEVLITGGSGGGQATYVLADYVASLFPTSVKKVGAVPMSGWFNSEPSKSEWTFTTHSMSGSISPGCSDAFEASERHNCIDPEHAYKHSTTPMFVIQVLDSQSIGSLYMTSAESDSTEAAKQAWTVCLKEPSSQCDATSVGLLQNYLNNFTSTVTSTAKYSKKSEGGFLSTCTKHVFYKKDEYYNYAINGVTINDAVSQWWRNFQTSPAKWYLPCELNTHGQCQCESSCAFDSCKNDPGGESCE